MTEQKCKVCLVEKSIESFWFMWKKKDLRRKVCIECSKKNRKENIQPVDNTEKKCVKCDQNKRQYEFQSHSNQCRMCISKYLRERRKNIKREMTTDPRSCKRCNTLKAPIDFRPSKDSIGGIRRTCRECEGLPLKLKVIDGVAI